MGAGDPRTGDPRAGDPRAGGYKVSYLVNGDYVTVRNTESLIQTGQLNWPVPVLAGAGLVLVLAGAFALRRKRASHEEEPPEK